MDEQRDKLAKIIEDNPRAEQVFGEPTILDPMDTYKFLYTNPDLSASFGVYTIEDVDFLVKKTYIKDFWPKHLL